tara:strand:+ start:33750 stop:34001 length:252 start_codon:yes stop_codon:yes gene_type:complete
MFFVYSQRIAEALELLAEVVELVDTVDSKSTGSNPLSVQVRPSVSNSKQGLEYSAGHRSFHACSYSRIESRSYHPQDAILCDF